LQDEKELPVTDQTLPLPPEIDERSLVKKILFRLAPFLAILYVFCLIDRGNVANASLTMKPDLNFSNQVYGLGAGIFFIGYFIFEIPSNLFMEKVGARWWISRIMVSWGLVSAAMMFVHTPMQFYSLRFLLGIAEAGFFPGVILYFTYWIPATSRGRAISLFLLLTAFLGFFGGPLAGLLLKLDGIGGLHGWQWLFLLEGIPSVVLGIVVLFVLKDKPADASWLNSQEKQWLSSRLLAESHHKDAVQHLSILSGLTPERIQKLGVIFIAGCALELAVAYLSARLDGRNFLESAGWMALLVNLIVYPSLAGLGAVIAAQIDPRIRHMCLVFIVSSTAGNAVGFFQPALVQARSNNQWSPSFVSTILVIPGLVGAVAMMAAAGHSDRTGQRRLHILLGYTVAAMGYIACVFAPSGWSAVAALSLFSLGERIGAGSYWALTTNLLGARAAAGGIAIINSVGNLGGFIGPTVMGKIMDRTHGSYTAGLYMAAALMLTSAVLGGMMRKHPTHVAPSGKTVEDTVEPEIEASTA
jgi:MFS transporter, ACS family, tartrate transporter